MRKAVQLANSPPAEKPCRRRASTISRKRRRFLIGVAGTAAALLTPDTGRSQPDIGPAVSYEHRGRPIASNFTGLSYESAILAAGDYFTPSNSSPLGLIRSLGENGVIRIGGTRVNAPSGVSTRSLWSLPAS
jgi:hypothetical protein